MTPAGSPPAALQRPSQTDLALIVVAVSAVSTSGPLIRLAAAPALAVAFWRNLFASGVLVPIAWVRCRAELRALTLRERRLALTAGALLACHFATWIPSLSFTTVGSSVALVATQPVWAALIARLRGEHVPRLGWIGIVVAVAGAAVLSGVDFTTISARALFGDGLAMVGGMLAAAYMTVGAEVRRSVSTTTYTAICYSAAAAGLLLTCLVARTPLAGFTGKQWLCLLGLTVGAQLLGHSVFNRVLRTTSATLVSVSILFEIVGSVLLAAWWFGETPPLAALPAAVLIAAGIVLVIRAGARRPVVAGVD